MADLDDFFAKKDKKKSKTVKKFATTEEVSKKIDETKQKNDSKPKQTRPAQEGEEGSNARVTFCHLPLHLSSIIQPTVTCHFHIISASNTVLWPFCKTKHNKNTLLPN